MTTRFALLACFLSFAVPLSAQTVTFSSFDPVDSYVSNQYYTIDGPTDPTPQRVAAQFTSALGNRLHSVRFATRHVANNTWLNVDFYRDNNGSIGTWLTGWGGIQTVGFPHIEVRLNTGLSPVLVAGQKYWVELSTIQNGLHGWYLANPGHTSRVAWSVDHGLNYEYDDLQRTPAFEVLVVPEPGTLAALTLGGALLWRRRRARAGA